MLIWQAEVLAEAVAAFEGDFREALRQAGTLEGEVASFFGYLGRRGRGGGGDGGAAAGGGWDDDGGDGGDGRAGDDAGAVAAPDALGVQTRLFWLNLATDPIR